MVEWLRIVGTSHIAAEAERLITAAFDEFRPDVVAVELDASRLHALLSGERPDYSPRIIKSIGVRGYLFVVLGSWLQRKLGRIVNVTPGADMLAAVKLARRERKRVLLVDRHIQVTLRRLTKALGWQEVKATLRELCSRKKERLSLDLRRVPSKRFVAKLLQEFERQYPRPYAVLVTERNEHMVQALLRYHAQFPEQRILLVIGIGHQQGLEGLLQQQPI